MGSPKSDDAAVLLEGEMLQLSGRHQEAALLSGEDGCGPPEEASWKDGHGTRVTAPRGC